MAAVEIVVLRKIKLHGGVGRWAAHVVASDEHGRWLFSPKGTIYRGGMPGEPVVEIEVGQGTRNEGLHMLHLVPREPGWIASWYEIDGIGRITIDVGAPIEEIDGELAYVDLELDPFWKIGTEPFIDDEDEFAGVVATGTIDEPLAMHARTTADRLLERLCSQDEPFGSVGWDRFRTAVESGLEPIRTLDARWP